MAVRSSALWAAIWIGGCTLLQDSSTHLAYALEGAARALRESSEDQLIVRFTPLGDPGQAYTIAVSASRCEVRVDLFGNIDRPCGSGIRVTGASPGSTGYHERFVFTPKGLSAAKQAAPTEVVLQKRNGRIELVELR